MQKNTNPLAKKQADTTESEMQKNVENRNSIP